MRHGEIKANRARRWHGSTDSPLVWRGRRQAKRLGRYVAQRYPDLQALYASPRERCVDTATPVSRALNLDIQVVDDLQEWSIGELEDTPFEVLDKEHDFFNRVLADLEYGPPGGESINQVARRFLNALFTINQGQAAAELDSVAHTDADTDADAESDTYVGVVSHGAAIQVALAALLDGSAKRWQNYSIGNCSVTELVLTPKPYIGAYNQTHFL